MSKSAEANRKRELIIAMRRRGGELSAAGVVMASCVVRLAGVRPIGAVDGAMVGTSDEGGRKMPVVKSKSSRVGSNDSSR